MLSRICVGSGSIGNWLVAKGVVAALMLCMSGMAFPVIPDSGIAKSTRAAHDVPLALNPRSAFWRGAVPVSFDGDNYGRPVPQLRTIVRSRWTEDSLYLLFVCPYQSLNLNPSPQTQSETNHLWNWDVAEVFLGSDIRHIRQYKEFEVSPQGEWVDLDIDLDHPHPEGGVTWNSGFEVAARTDAAKKVWYGAMRIPFAAIGRHAPHAGDLYRVNFFRIEGPPPGRQLLAWQAPMGPSFHVPERFGQLQLVK